MLIDLIKSIKNNDTIWVMENRENSDKFFKEYVTDKLFSSTYVIVSSELVYVFVHKLDEGNVHVLDENYSRVYIYSTAEELRVKLLEVLKELSFPKQMLLSYTTMSDENTDIISYSSYKRVTKLFRSMYKENDKKIKVNSAQMNIYDIISKNTKEDIERLKKLASITDKILKESFYSIKVGQSEKDIALNTKNITKKIMDNKKESLKLLSYDFAWDICPIVLVGDNLQKGGHAEPSNTRIKKGDTIYYDFGISATFEDGKTLYTDMQRMGYMLKDNEKDAPGDVKKVFNVLVESISDGIKSMKPGVKGYKVDNIVRSKIVKNGFPDYPHATGHPVGKEVHAAGALISYRTGKRAKLNLVENGVYTLEPRVNIKNGGSIEEMILVTNSGGIPLCNIQKELYLI